MAILSTADTTNAVTRGIILDYFEKTGVSSRFSFKEIDPVVKQTAYDTIRTWNLGVPDRTIERYATVGLVIATTAYRHTPIEVQVAIALYTFCCTIADDNLMSNDILREFSTRFFDGQPQLHPILTHLVEFMTGMRQHYSSYSANAVIVSTVDFFSAEMFLRDEGGTVLSGPQASEYVDYIRWKSGVGEAYAVFIWPHSMFPETKTYIQAIPYAVQFICLTNDLLSFHKEYKAGERDNYVNQHATAYGQPVSHTLYGMVDRVTKLDANIKTILGDGPEREAWETFTTGYTEFHLWTPRYFLQEIVPEYF